MKLYAVMFGTEEEELILKNEAALESVITNKRACMLCD
jgi:hypothetical protein